MTFNQLILKNLRKNIKHYGMFLFSLLISIILYFSFSTLKYSHSINNSDSSTIIKNGATIGATILFIIIVVFLMYANHLFIKRRTKEFALYQLIGFNTWKYSKNAQYRTTSIFYCNRNFRHFNWYFWFKTFTCYRF